MKRILWFLLVGVMAAQTTPNLHLNLPLTGTQSWGTQINSNFTTLDTYLGALRSSAGVFTGSFQNYNFFSSIDGSAAWRPQPVGSEEAIVGAVTVPSTATITQANAVAGYVTNASTSMGGGGAVAGYFSGTSLVNNSGSNDVGVWGANMLCNVYAPLNPNLQHCLGIEVDVDNNTGSDWNKQNAKGIFDGVDIISGGAHKARIGLSITAASTPAGDFNVGQIITSYSRYGLKLGDPSLGVSGAVGELIWASDNLATTPALDIWTSTSSGPMFRVMDTGTVYITALSALSNCQLGGARGTPSAAQCNAAPTGMIAIPVSLTSYTIDTTAVTANSEIFIEQMTDNSGLPSRPTCNGTATNPIQSSRSPRVSFTFTLSSTANVTCYKYWIVN